MLVWVCVYICRGALLGTPRDTETRAFSCRSSAVHFRHQLVGYVSSFQLRENKSLLVCFARSVQNAASWQLARRRCRRRRVVCHVLFLMRRLLPFLRQTDVVQDSRIIITVVTPNWHGARHGATSA